MRTRLVALWRSLLSRVARRDRGELAVMIGGVALLALALAFTLLAAEVLDGNTQQFDERVMASLRRQEDPTTPIGPAWLRSAALDVTALGSATVLGLAVLAIVGFLTLQGMWRTAGFVFVASCGGWLLNGVLKQTFQRSRPDIVPHLREVFTASFPSGHALTSAAVYLTLGALLMRLTDRPIVKFYSMAVAATATALVGVSRVYLGVHFPSDVLAGWLIGLSWALLCWIIEQRIGRRAGLKREQAQAGG